MRMRTCPSRRSRPHRRGFTLLEAMTASAILFAVVVSVISTITAGQQHSYVASTQVAASLAAEDLLDRLVSMSYGDLAGWNGHVEAVGTMKNADGQSMGPRYQAVGRSATMTTVLKSTGVVGVRVRGKEILVRAFDAADRTLAEFTRFVAEPQS